jgi:hypothetical protein
MHGQATHVDAASASSQTADELDLKLAACMGEA